MKRKKKTRNPMASSLANACFRKKVVRNKKLYTRKGRAVVNNYRGSSSL